MPIYEFYCSRCHTCFQFLSRRIDTTSRPPCPACGRVLSREVSPFATLRKGGSDRDAEADGDEAGFPVDDHRLEQAMAQMAGDLDAIQEDDPRQAAGLMRKFSQLTGMRFKGSIEEAIARMEGGEDPESVEADLGEALEDDNPFELADGGKAGSLRRLLSGPRRDPTLYEMD